MLTIKEQELIELTEIILNVGNDIVGPQIVQQHKNLCSAVLITPKSRFLDAQYRKFIEISK